MYVKPLPLSDQHRVQLGGGVSHHQVRDPDRRDRLPIEGREVPDSPYWYRRLAERSVEVAEPPAEKPVRRAGPPSAKE